MCVPAAADLHYVWGPRYVDDLVLRDKSSERLFAMQDANWNVVAIADATAVVQERYAYSPYGVAVFLTPTFTSRASSSFNWQRLFTGQTYDTQTGLHYFRNRMLHSQVGTFITRDPIGYADGLHLYRAWFVPNDLDPSGACRCPGGGWTTAGSGGGFGFFGCANKSKVTATCKMAEHRADRVYNCDGITFTKRVLCVCKVDIVTISGGAGASVGGSYGWCFGNIEGCESPEACGGLGPITGTGEVALVCIGGSASGPVLGGAGAREYCIPLNFGLGVNFSITQGYSWLSNVRVECKRDALNAGEKRIVEMARANGCPCTHKDTRLAPYKDVTWPW